MKWLIAFSAWLTVATCMGVEPIKPSEASFGVFAVSLPDVVARLKPKSSEIPAKTGVIVLAVFPRGPASEAKMQPLTIITRVNQKLIKDADEFSSIVRGLTPGKLATFSGYRPLEIGERIRWTSQAITKITPVSYRDAVYRSLKQEKDEISGTTTYQHAESSDSTSERSDFLLKIVAEKTGSARLLMQIQYVGRDWLFIDGFTIKADDETFTISADSEDIKRDFNSRGVWEWWSKFSNDQDRKMLDAVASGNAVMLRYSGRDYKHDREISWDELGRLRIVLSAYDLLTTRE